jgi:hypothetical protein
MTTRRVVAVALSFWMVQAIVPSGTSAQDTTAVGLVPPGFGTLRQDDVAVRLDTPNVKFRVLPMSDPVITLLAPDSYQPLHRLREARSADIAAAALRMGVVQATVFLVTAFGVQEQAPFEPEQLTITSQNRMYRPVAILPLSPLWNQHRLTQRETATAIFVFEGGIDFFEALTMEYLGVMSDQWTQNLPRLESERARVSARAAQQRRPPNQI